MEIKIMAKLQISGNKKYLDYLKTHLAKEHRKTKGKTKILK